MRDLTANVERRMLLWYPLAVLDLTAVKHATSFVFSADAPFGETRVPYDFLLHVYTHAKTAHNNII